MANELFPVLNQQNCRPSERKTMPRSVPWSLVEPWREQAYANHEQTLERLAERGGLAPEELYAVAHGLGTRKLIDGSIDEQAAIDWLNAALKQHDAERESDGT
jgi:hypothetical protein